MGSHQNKLLDIGGKSPSNWRTMLNLLTIHQIRKRATRIGVGTVALADLAGLSPTTINRLERLTPPGKYNGQIRTLTKLQDALCNAELELLGYLLSISDLPLDAEAELKDEVSRRKARANDD